MSRISSLTETTGFMSPHSACGGVVAGDELAGGDGDGRQAESNAKGNKATESFHLDMQ
jgi:hypothetical protein